MTGVIVIKSVEQLIKFLDKNGIFEIAIRGANSKFKIFQKIALDLPKENGMKESILNSIKSLLQNDVLATGDLALDAGNLALASANLKLSIDIKKIVSLTQHISSLSLILNGVNLCATVAGFVIIAKKLNETTAVVNKAINLIRTKEGINADFEFNKVLSEYQDMLDCRKKQVYYTENQMRELIDREYNVLKMLSDVFINEITENQESLIFSIYSLASMLAVSIKYFDEIYYYKYKSWHIGHDKWLSIFDTLQTKEFTEKIQDFGIFELGLNTIENDCYYSSLLNQVKDTKQEIADNQMLIEKIGNATEFKEYTELSKTAMRDTITEALKQSGADLNDAETAETLNELFKQVAIA